MSQPTLTRITGCAVIVLLGARIAAGSVGLPLTLEALVAQSDVIVMGRVAGIASGVALVGIWLLITGVVFLILDQEPATRQLYEIAELGKPADQPTRTPEPSVVSAICGPLCREFGGSGRIRVRRRPTAWSPVRAARC